jgi:single-strand DNA-binding protein
MMNYNRVIMVGRLTRDPELRTTPDGVSLVRCRIAVNRRTGGEEVPTPTARVFAARHTR